MTTPKMTKSQNLVVKPIFMIFLGQHQNLHRLQIAIDTNQKQFVTHASVQQLLAAIWYDGLPGFRRLHFVRVSKNLSQLNKPLNIH
jgi:hypothetical protein